jgi:DNA-binding transcriptional LysR family regulator
MPTPRTWEVPGLSAALTDEVQSGELDVADVGRHPRGLPPGVHAVSKESVPSGAACAGGHRLASHKKVGIRSLQVRDFFRRVGVNDDVVFRVADIPSMLDLVACGPTIALLPKRATTFWPGITYVPLADHPPVCNCGIVVGSRGSSAVKAFVEILG